MLYIPIPEKIKVKNFAITKGHYTINADTPQYHNFDLSKYIAYDWHQGVSNIIVTMYTSESILYCKRKLSS